MKEVFELLARELECRITADRAVQKPLTLRVVNMRASDIVVTICRSIDCEWRFDGKDWQPSRAAHDGLFPVTADGRLRSRNSLRFRHPMA